MFPKHSVKSSLRKFQKYWKGLTNSLKILYSFASILFLVSVIFFIISFNEAIKLRWSLSTDGVSNLTKIFDVPIKSVGAFLGTITLFAAIKRMIANDTQVKIAIEQNRLSNYFIFRKEFINHMITSSFHKYYSKVYKDKSNEELHYPLFFHFYGSYSDFNAKLKSEVSSAFCEFTEAGRKLAAEIDKTKAVIDLDQVSEETIKNLMKVIPKFKVVGIDYVLMDSSMLITQTLFKLSNQDLMSSKFRLVAKLVQYLLTIMLSRDLSTFCGETNARVNTTTESSIPTFIRNMTGFYLNYFLDEECKI